MSTNVQAEIKGDKLVLTIDISDKVLKNAPRSSTGKSQVIASTHGFTQVGNGLGLQMGVNIIKK